MRILNNVDRKIIGDICSLFLGALLVCAFAPFNHSWLSFIILSLFLTLIIHETAARSGFRGFLFGVGFFGVGISWIFNAVHIFGSIPSIGAFLLVAGLIVGASFYITLEAYLFQKLWSKDTWKKRLIIFPSLWVLGEYLRSYFLTGFPWLLLGTSQVNGIFHGLLPVLGGYGVSWCVVFLAGVLSILIRDYAQEKFVTPRQKYFIAAVVVLLLITSFGVQKMKWTKPIGKPISFSLVQGNAPGMQQWNTDAALNDTLIYLKMTQPFISTPFHKQQRVIVWPEASLLVLGVSQHQWVSEFNRLLTHINSSLLLGMPVEHGDKMYNGLVAVGMAHGHYYKRHLVPFGEYVPFTQALSSLLQALGIEVGGYTRGANNQGLIHLHKIRLAPLICYEIAYSKLVKSDAQRSNIMIVVSNDIWFGRSIAAWQHIQIAQMQARITGRPIVFVANTGVTGFINIHGKLTSVAPRFKRYILSQKVQPVQGETPWDRWGDRWIMCLILLSVFVF